MNLAMPRLSDTMEEGTLGRWLKHEGETIEKGEVIAEIQTDKANMELEAFQGGVLEKILVQEGETVPIGQAIAVIGTGQDGAQRPSQPSEPAQAAEPQVTARPAPEPAPQPATQPAAEPVLPAAKGPEGRIKASPLARRLAHEHGLELAQIPGTGPNGRITRDDVQQAAAIHPAPEQAAPSRAPEPTVAVQAGEVQPFTRIQQIIAQRMVESKTQVPHIYISLEVDMAKAMQLRQDINALGGQKVSFNDIVIKGCATALRAYPQANVSYTQGGTQFNPEVNVGFAVAQEGGLIVPVIRNADQKSLRQIASDARALIEKARENRLAPSDLTGGTFTITNLGMYGVDEFMAVINQPESAILAVGAIVQKPVVENGQIVVGHRMRLTLSADHRVLYGAHAAEFLGKLRELLEQPLNLGF